MAIAFFDVGCPACGHTFYKLGEDCPACGMKATAREIFSAGFVAGDKAGSLAPNIAFDGEAQRAYGTWLEGKARVFSEKDIEFFSERNFVRGFYLGLVVGALISAVVSILLPLT